ncbi:translation initiation factor IF-2 [Bacteroidia bacterium]|nr:translation initiation factor IF-2 [Bacteroidia bacterium]
MAIRLSKIAREFNVGITTIVDFLAAKKVIIPSDPNTKVEDAQYDMIAREFSSDSKLKKEATLLDAKGSHGKKETVIIDNRGNITEGDEGDEDTFISVKNEVKLEATLKVIDHIDLKDPKPKKTKKDIASSHPPSTPAATKKKKLPQESETGHTKEAQPEEEKENVEEQPNVNTDTDANATSTANEVADTLVDTHTDTLVDTHTDTLVDTENSLDTDRGDGEDIARGDGEDFPVGLAEIDDGADAIAIEDIDDIDDEEELVVEQGFRIKQPVVNDLKVIGSIDLNSINQLTRPPKKSKAEREREKQEFKESRKFVRPAVEPPIKAIVASDDEDVETRKKRKRILRSEEKILIPRPDKTTLLEDSKKKLKKLKKKKDEHVEIKDEDVDKQIKDTLARLGSKGKSDRSKHRRDKRDAVQQKLQVEQELEELESHILKLTEFVTVVEFASMMNISVTDVISSCMSLGLFVSINQRLDAETIVLIASEFGFEVEFVSVDIQEAIEDEEDVDTPDLLIPRPPIVTVMGHVDHGKTSLLDYIRKTNVIAGEAGGITQHIGAYSVQLADGRAVTFLDTPGHEAFTAMRARGAQVTDIAIIIIAADDNVMPQTIEAINHASAAGVPIVFAINKVDKPGANSDKIKESLSKMNYLVEEWGGKYQSQDISAKKGLYIEELLEKVLLEAEMLELKANPNRKAIGTVIESSLDKGRGYVATVLVERGTLKVGDMVLAGRYHGNVKAIFNERGARLTEVAPSEPALILGLSGAPQAGDKFNVMSNEKEARILANKREQLQREQGLRTQKHITLDEIGRRIAIGNFQELNVIVKGDVDGSVEALSDSLIKLSTEEIQVNVIHKAVGQISEGDVMLAAASNAIIVGFQVRPSVGARKIAEREQIDIRLYSVIYKAIEELTSAMEGMLSPEIKEEITSSVEVLEVYNITKVGTVAGCIVRDGKVVRATKIRLIRDGIVIHSGELGSLKRFKDDVKEVSKGFECGLNIVNYSDIQVGDFIESYEEVMVKKTLK